MSANQRDRTENLGRWTKQKSKSRFGWNRSPNRMVAGELTLGAAKIDGENRSAKRTAHLREIPTKTGARTCYPTKKIEGATGVLAQRPWMNTKNKCQSRQTGKCPTPSLTWVRKTWNRPSTAAEPIPRRTNPKNPNRNP
jgi:hypothetical protein